jgi:predicted DNA-binding ribbon-helix-helix protein
MPAAEYFDTKHSSRVMASTLVSRNVTIHGRRTSIRLESGMWDALHEVARARGQTIHQFCSEVDAARRESSLTAAIRMALLEHYRQATQPAPGSSGAGGGGGDPSNHAAAK